MKNMFLIALLLVVTFYAIHLLDVKEPYCFGTIKEVTVSEKNCMIELNIPNKNLNRRWFYDYELSGDSLYVTTYKVVNPRAKLTNPPVKVQIDKGSQDFDKIYINMEDGNQLIWQEEEA